MTATKALIGEENGDWELRSVKPSKEDDSYEVGEKDYLAKPSEHIRSLKVKTFFGYKRYKFFIAYAENPIPFDLSKRGVVSPLDTATAVRSFRRAHIVQALGRAARELPGNNKEQMQKMIFFGALGIIAILLYYTGALNSLIDWATGAP